MAIVESERAGVLLERERLLDDLGEALLDAERGNGCLVLVGGEAGAGKTALVRQFADDAGTAGSFLAGGCDPPRTARSRSRRARKRARRRARRPARRSISGTRTS